MKLLRNTQAVPVTRAIAATAVTVVIGFAAGGIASASGGHGRGHVVVHGSAVNQYPTPAGPGSARLRVAARSAPDGSDPRGYVSAAGTAGAPMSEFTVGGKVTCVRTDGNRASIKYRFDRASGSAAALVGGGVEIFIEDNGRKGHGSVADANAFSAPQSAATFDAAATQCDDPNVAAYDGVESGGYTLRTHAGHHRGHR